MLNKIHERLIFILLGTSMTAVWWIIHWLSPAVRRKHLEHHLKVCYWYWCNFYSFLCFYKGRLKGEKLCKVNKHFGDWLLLHLLKNNIDRRTFQVHFQFTYLFWNLKRNLTNISEDFYEEGEIGETDRFFLPGNKKERKAAVTFENWEI